MQKVYHASSIVNDPDIRDKVSKNPELVLITMESKAILSKHQNDFAQYMLRNLELDELRAIRAILPKFRNDQKRQLDWVESLENKIEQVASAPPKKAAPPKPPAKLSKPKKILPPAGAPTGDMFAELLAKRKKLGTDGEPEAESPKEKEEKQKVGTLKLGKTANKGSSLTVSQSSTPPVSPGPRPPPPPPPPL